MTMDIHDFRKLVENNTTESNLKLKEYLISINVFTIIFPHGENLLHFACGAGNIEICKYLIEEKKIHPNIYNSRGATPLIYACLKNQIEVVRLLLSYNADPRIRSGFSGLFPYQSTQNKEICDMLLLHDSIVPIDYENGLKIKTGYNLYQSYKYRKHKYWLTFVTNEMMRISGNQQIDRLNETEEIINVLEQGFDKLLEMYQEIYNDYISSLVNVDTRCCLSCSNSSTQLFRCSKCKQVLVCGKKCQKQIHMLHQYDCTNCIS